MRALEHYGDWVRALEQAGVAVIGSSSPTSAWGDAPRAWNLKGLMRGFRVALTRDPQLGDGLLRALTQQQRGSPAASLSKGAILDALARLYLGSNSYHLNFHGPPGSIRTIPYYAFIKGDAGRYNLDLRGTAVFVGYSELAFPTKLDSFDTVFTREDTGVQLSGVEIAATAFANLLTGRTLRPADPLTTALVLLTLGCVIGACAFLLPPSRAIPAAIGVAMAYVAGAQLLFSYSDAWLPLAVPILLELPLLLFAGLLYQRKSIWAAIRIFVPDDVARETADHPRDPVAVRHTAFATCLASDAEAYTTLSERMKPDEAAAFLNEYFAALAEPLQRHGVNFREFHADGMLAAWIATTAEAQVRERACFAALEALAAIEAFNARKAPLHLGVRLGLHAGEIFLGNVGAGGRFAFRLVGDIVNTASRIEGLNKTVGTRLLATAAVVHELDGLLLRPLGRFQLRGKQGATAVVEIVSTRQGASSAQASLCDDFARALQAHDELRWNEAADRFRDILRVHPDDRPSRFYLRRCLSEGHAAATASDPTIIRIGTALGEPSPLLQRQ
jgi:adenylate cyclase